MIPIVAIDFCNNLYNLYRFMGEGNSVKAAMDLYIWRHIEVPRTKGPSK